MSKNKIYLIFLVIVVSGILGYQVYKRKQLLSKNGILGIGKLIEIKKTTKGVTTRQTIAFVEYFVDSIRYEYTTPAFPNTNIGYCYEITYVPDSPKVVKVNFKKEVPCDY